MEGDKGGGGYCTAPTTTLASVTAVCGGASDVLVDNSRLDFWPFYHILLLFALHFSLVLLLFVLCLVYYAVCCVWGFPFFNFMAAKTTTTAAATIIKSHTMPPATTNK